MKLELSALGAGLAAAACVSGAAEAQAFKPFLEVGTGYVNSIDDTYTVIGGGDVESGGYGVPGIAAVGLKDIIGPLSLRFDYYGSGVDVLGAFTSTVNVEAYYANLLLDLPLNDRNQYFYLGGGVGNVHGTYGSSCAGPGCPAQPEADATGAQAFFGLRGGAFGPVSAFLEGRYLYSEDMEFDNNLVAHYRSWGVLVGLRIGGL